MISIAKQEAKARSRNSIRKEGRMWGDIKRDSKVERKNKWKIRVLSTPRQMDQPPHILFLLLFFKKKIEFS